MNTYAWIVSNHLQVSAWYFYACFLWGLKAMVLFLFSRLSLPVYQRRLLKIFTFVGVITWIAVILTISFGCRPFHRNWGTIPYPPARCTSRTQNFYTASTLNITTDAAILLVTLPVLWNLRVPLSRKIALTLLLCSGIFVISAAVVALLMSLLDAHSTLNTNRWATREEIAGILAVNAPILKPMFHRSFWRRDFPAPRPVRPHRAIRGPVIDPEFLMETPPPAAARRLGVLSSLKSSYFTRSSRRDASSRRTEDSSTQGADYEAFKESKELEAAWGIRGRDGNVVAFPPSVARGGPEPLRPTPERSWTSRGDSLQWSGLQAINEEDFGRKVP